MIPFLFLGSYNPDNDDPDPTLVGTWKAEYFCNNEKECVVSESDTEARIFFAISEITQQRDILALVEWLISPICDADPYCSMEEMFIMEGFLTGNYVILAFQEAGMLLEEYSTDPRSREP